MENIASTVEPSGFFITAALRNCPEYPAGKDKKTGKVRIKKGIDALDFYNCLKNTNLPTNEKYYLLLDNAYIHSTTKKLMKLGLSMEEFLKIEPSVAPLPGEVVVVKRRVCAFTGSDLEVVLRSQGIQHIVLTGVATSGVVLSTVREAADKDYRITVLSDCCADGDEEVHRVLTTKVFPRQADVMALEEWNKT